MHGYKSSPADQANARLRGVPSFILNERKTMLKFDPGSERGKKGKDTKVLTGKDYKQYIERALQAYRKNTGG